MYRLCVGLLIFLMGTLFANPHPYVIATHPKGGSHLLIKILNMIHGYRPAHLFCHYDGHRFHPNMINACWHSGGMPWVHLFAPLFTYQYFQANHPDFKVVIIIRDLRDAYVSYAHWVYKDADISEEEKINRVFNDEGYFVMSSYLSIFLNDPRFYVVKFEDLIGPQGGGNKDRQVQTIYDLAAYIGMPISQSLAFEYSEKLFGDSSGTFRQGQIGSWKKAFNETQKDWFKKHFGDELIRLGYEQGYDW